MNRRTLIKLLNLTPLAGLLGCKKPEPEQFLLPIAGDIGQVFEVNWNLDDVGPTKDHLLCGVGGVYNCSECRFSQECKKGYEDEFSTINDIPYFNEIMVN